MKCLILTLMLCLTLVGCGKQSDPKDAALSLRTDLMAGGCEFTADVTADYGDRVYEFTLDCDYDDGKGSFAVTAPEEIAGIAGTVTENGAAVEFDGMALDFGTMANGTVAPLTLPWLLPDAWISGYIHTVAKDDGRVLVTYLLGYGKDEVTLDTRLENGIPVYAEVFYDGTRCLSAEIREFELPQEGETHETAETDLGGRVSGRPGA